MRGGGQGRERGTYLFGKWLIMCSWHFLQLNIFYNRGTRHNWCLLSHILRRKNSRNSLFFFFVCECALVCRKCKKVTRSIWTSWSWLQRTWARSRFRFVRSENRESAITVSNIFIELFLQCKKIITRLWHYPCFKCLYFLLANLWLQVNIFWNWCTTALYYQSN